MAEGPNRNIWDLIGDVKAPPNTDADGVRRRQAKADPPNSNLRNNESANNRWLKGFEKLKKRVECRPQSPSKDATKSNGNSSLLPFKQRKRASSPVLSMMSKKLKVEMLEMRASFVSISASPECSNAKIQSTVESHCQHFAQSSESKPLVVVSGGDSEKTQIKEVPNQRTFSSIPLFESLSNVCRMTSRSARESPLAVKQLCVSREDNPGKSSSFSTREVQLPTAALVHFPLLSSSVVPENSRIVSNCKPSPVDCEESWTELKQDDYQNSLNSESPLVEPEESQILLEPQNCQLFSNCKPSPVDCDESQAVIKQDDCQNLLNSELSLVEPEQSQILLEPQNCQLFSNCKPSPVDCEESQAVIKQDDCQNLLNSELSLVEPEQSQNLLEPQNGQIFSNCRPSPVDSEESQTEIKQEECHNVMNSESSLVEPEESQMLLEPQNCQLFSNCKPSPVDCEESQAVIKQDDCQNLLNSESSLVVPEESQMLLEPQNGQLFSNCKPSPVDCEESQTVIKQDDCQNLLNSESSLVVPEESQMLLEPHNCQLFSNCKPSPVDCEESQAVIKQDDCQNLLNSESSLVVPEESQMLLEPQNGQLFSNCKPSPVDFEVSRTVIEQDDCQNLLNSESSLVEPEECHILLQPQNGQIFLNCKPSSIDCEESPKADKHYDCQNLLPLEPLPVESERSRIVLEAENNRIFFNCNQSPVDCEESQKIVKNLLPLEPSLIELKESQIALKPYFSQNALYCEPIEEKSPPNFFVEISNVNLIHRSHDDVGQEVHENVGEGVIKKSNEFDLLAIGHVLSVSLCNSLKLVEIVKRTSPLSATEMCERTEHLKTEVVLLNESGSGVTDVDDGKSTVGSGVTDVDDGKSTVGSGVTDVNDGKSTVGSGVTDVDDGKSTVGSGVTDVDDGKSAVGSGVTYVDYGKSTVGSGVTDVDDGKSTVGSGVTDVDAGKSTVRSSVTDVDDGKSTVVRNGTRLSGTSNDSALSIVTNRDSLCIVDDNRFPLCRLVGEQSIHVNNCGVVESGESTCALVSIRDSSDISYRSQAKSTSKEYSDECLLSLLQPYKTKDFSEPFVPNPALSSESCDDKDLPLTVEPCISVHMPLSLCESLRSSPKPCISKDLPSLADLSSSLEPYEGTCLTALQEPCVGKDSTELRVNENSSFNLVASLCKEPCQVDQVDGVRMALDLKEMPQSCRDNRPSDDVVRMALDLKEMPQSCRENRPSDDVACMALNLKEMPQSCRDNRPSDDLACMALDLKEMPQSCRENRPSDDVVRMALDLKEMPQSCRENRPSDDVVRMALDLKEMPQSCRDNRPSDDLACMALDLKEMPQSCRENRPSDDVVRMALDLKEMPQSCRENRPSDDVVRMALDLKEMPQSCRDNRPSDDVVRMALDLKEMPQSCRENRPSDDVVRMALDLKEMPQSCRDNRPSDDVVRMALDLKEMLQSCRDNRPSDDVVRMALDLKEMPQSCRENRPNDDESEQLSHCFSSTDLKPRVCVLKRSISAEINSKKAPDSRTNCLTSIASYTTSNFKSSTSCPKSHATSLRSRTAGLLEHFELFECFSKTLNVARSANGVDGHNEVSVRQNTTPGRASSCGTLASVDLPSTASCLLPTGAEHSKPKANETREFNPYTLILNTLPNNTADCDSIELCSLESGLDTDDSSNNSLNLPTAEELDLSCVVSFASLNSEIKEEDSIISGRDMSESVEDVSLDLEELTPRVDSIDDEGKAARMLSSSVSSEVFEDANSLSGRLLNGCWFTDAQIERVLHALLEPCTAQAMDDLSSSMSLVPESGSVEYNTESKVSQSCSDGACFSMVNSNLLEDLIATERGSPVPDIGLLSAVLEDNCIESGSQHSCCSSLDGFLRAEDVECSFTRNDFTDHSLKITSNSKAGSRLQAFLGSSGMVRNSSLPQGNRVDDDVTVNKFTIKCSTEDDSNLSTRSPFGFTDAASIAKLRDACSAVDATSLRSMQLEKHLRNFIYDTDYFKKRVEMSLPPDLGKTSSSGETCQQLSAPIEGRCCCEGNKRRCRTLLRMPEKLLGSLPHSKRVAPLFSLLGGNDSLATNRKRKLREEMMSIQGEKKNKAAKAESIESASVLKEPKDVEFKEPSGGLAEELNEANGSYLNIPRDEAFISKRNLSGRTASRNLETSEVNGLKSGSDELVSTPRGKRPAVKETVLSRSLDSSSAERLWESCTFNISNKAFTNNKELSVAETTSKSRKNSQRLKMQLEQALTKGAMITDYFSKTLSNGSGVNGCADLQGECYQNTRNKSVNFHQTSVIARSLSTGEIGTYEEGVMKRKIRRDKKTLTKVIHDETNDLVENGSQPCNKTCSSSESEEEDSTKSGSHSHGTISTVLSPFSRSFDSFNDLREESAAISMISVSAEPCHKENKCNNCDEPCLKENNCNNCDVNNSLSKRASRKRCLLLKQLANSEGYVADKRETKLDNLLVDSTMLGREERALQMALMRIREMETLSNLKPLPNKTSSENKAKCKSDDPSSKSIPKSTKSSENHKKLFISRQQRNVKQKCKDFAPDRNRHLTRVYADKKLKARRTQGLNSKAQTKSADDFSGFSSTYHLRNRVKHDDVNTQSSKVRVDATRRTWQSFHDKEKSRCQRTGLGHQLLEIPKQELSKLECGEDTDAVTCSSSLSILDSDSLITKTADVVVGDCREFLVVDRSLGVEVPEMSSVVSDDMAKDTVRRRRLRSRWRRGHIRKHGRRRQKEFVEKPLFIPPTSMEKEDDRILPAVEVAISGKKKSVGDDVEGLLEEVKRISYKCDLLTSKKTSSYNKSVDPQEGLTEAELQTHQEEPKGEDSLDTEEDILSKMSKGEINGLPEMFSRKGLLASVTAIPEINARQVCGNVATLARRRSSSLSTISSDSTDSRMHYESKALVSLDDDCTPFFTTDSGISVDSLLPMRSNIKPVIDISTTSTSASSSLQDLLNFNHLVVPAEVKKIAIDFSTGETVLHKAARLGYLTAALWCCKTGHVEVNARNNADYTPLHESCAHGHAAVAECLIFYGADINAISRLDGARPLHDAVESDSVDTVRLLLAAGADVSLTTYSGKNIFQLCRSVQMKSFLQAPSDILSNLPADCDDDGLMLENCDAMFPTTYHLNVAGSDVEFDKYVLLVDIVDRLAISRRQLVSLHSDLQTYQLAWQTFKVQTMLFDFKTIEQRLDRLYAEDQLRPLDDVTPCHDYNCPRVVEVIKFDSRLRRLFQISLFDVERNRSRD